jgi:hypothetical protein
MRTVQSYSRMLADFFGRTGKPPDRVSSSDVLGWAHGIGVSGRRPSSTTIAAGGRRGESLIWQTDQLPVCQWNALQRFGG